MTQDEFLRKKGKLVTTGLTDEEISIKMIRTDGGAICSVCGKEHRDHPYIDEARDWDGYPFLHLICDGMIVKL